VPQTCLCPTICIIPRLLPPLAIFKRAPKIRQIFGRDVMRFLMLNWRDPRNPLAGGAERVTLGYLSALAQRGHDVYWFAFDFPGATPIEEIDGVKIVRGGGVGTAILRAIRWTRQQPPFDLIIDQHHGIPWLAPWWSGTRCVAYIHEVLGPIWDAFYNWPLNRIGQVQERWAHWLYRDVPFWTACESTRDDLLAHGVRDVTIIRYGVHTVALPELPAKPLVAPLRLIVVARLAPNKRVDHAVRTVQCLSELGVDAHLEIVGSGETETHLRQIVAELNLAKSVFFIGHVSELEKDQRLAEAHFLLHTSQREGWGLNVIEANAMGTPAAVYPVRGLIESTLHEETGLVSAQETPRSLAEAMTKLLFSPHRYQNFREQAWNRAKTFHWSVILPQACDWLESMAQKPRRL
jgi:glycosyltransferase involved in cell wall biosynthesis